MAATAGSNGSDTPAVGAVGQELLRGLLQRSGPRAAIKEFSVRGAISQPLCSSLMLFVKEMGLPYYEAHRSVLTSAKAAVLAQLTVLAASDTDESKAAMERLLAASFYYLACYELRDVPLAVMSAMEEVPPNWLKQLALDKRIFRDLPPKVQRQVRGLSGQTTVLVLKIRDS